MSEYVKVKRQDYENLFGKSDNVDEPSGSRYVAVVVAA